MASVRKTTICSWLAKWSLAADTQYNTDVDSVVGMYLALRAQNGLSVRLTAIGWQHLAVRTLVAMQPLQLLLYELVLIILCLSIFKAIFTYV